MNRYIDNLINLSHNICLGKWISAVKNAFFHLLKKLGIMKDMGIRFGPFDPLQLTFNVMNTLMKKGVISYDEARIIIRGSLPTEMPESEKEALLNSMIQRIPPIQ